jgi:glycosyltransferase involved in cell wall biosynthesis
MNILISAPNYFPKLYGGIQTYIYGLVDELSARGRHKITVLTSKPWADSPGEYEVEEYYYKSIPVIALAINPFGMGEKEKHTEIGPLSHRALIRVLSDCKPDIVHINHMVPALTTACAGLGIPTVVTVHNARITCPAPPSMESYADICNKAADPHHCVPCCSNLRLPKWHTGRLLGKIPPPLYRWYGTKLAGKENLSYLMKGLIYPWLIEQDVLEKKNVFELATCIVAPSRHVKDRLTNNSFDLEKVLFIPHGISPQDDSCIKKRGGEIVRFGYVGRITPSKGLHLMLEAASLLPERPACEIHIFGSARRPADERYVKKLLLKYKGLPAVYEHGALQYSDRYKAFDNIDILVVPSIAPEAFGLVVNEAFSAGVPVIVSAVGSLPELVRDGIDGFVVERNSPQALSGAMQKIIENPELIIEMTEHIPHIKTAAEYNDEIVLLYNRLIKTGGQDGLSIKGEKAPESQSPMQRDNTINTACVQAEKGVRYSRDDHWPDFAMQWGLLGPPLKPVAQDVGFSRDAIMEWSGLNGAPRALILGVTPETYRLSWPEGTDLLAADRNQAMIDHVWPGPKDAALLTDWLNLNLPDSSRDIVLCDGGLHLLSYPSEQSRLVRVLGNILSSGGLFIIRLFTPPMQKEPPDAVMEDLFAGRISNLNVLKLRLGMSIMENSEEGAQLEKVWKELHRFAPDPGKLAAKIGWTSEHISAINAYRDSAVRYCFVTLNQVAAMFCGDPGGFEVKCICYPSYELGERCPTLVLQRKPRNGRKKDR